MSLCPFGSDVIVPLRRVTSLCPFGSTADASLPRRYGSGGSVQSATVSVARSLPCRCAPDLCCGHLTWACNRRHWQRNTRHRHTRCDMAICHTAWPPCLPTVPLGCQVRVSNILHFLNPINLQVQEMRAGPYAALSTPPPPLRVHTRTRTQTHAHQPWWLGVSISSRASPGFAFASAIAGLGRHQVLGVVVPCGGQHEAADRVCRPRRRTARPLAR